MIKGGFRAWRGLVDQIFTLEEGREQRLPGFLYVDDLVLWGESEEDLRVMVRWFV